MKSKIIRPINKHSTDEFTDNGTKKKWRHNDLPTGYPNDCSDDQIRQVIQDLYEEKSSKLLNGKDNIIWEKVINGHIENGRGELSIRRGIINWHEKPIGQILLGVFTTVVAGLILFKLG